MQVLRVVVYSEDRSVLAHLSRLLMACGYEVRQASDRMAAAMELAAPLPHVLLLDAESNLAESLDLCRAASTGGAENRPYIMMLCGAAALQAIRQAWEAGADDFLRRPVVCGELFARLRFAARALEFQRRMAGQPGVDPLTGLPNRAAFVQRVRARMCQPAGQVQPGADAAKSACTSVSGSPASPTRYVVIADVDRLDAINRRQGWPAGDAVLRHAAEFFAQRCGPQAVVASFGGGRFAILLDHMRAPEAMAFAESLRTDFEGAHRPGGADPATAPSTPPVGPITISLGLAACLAGAPAEEAITQAEQALAAARAAGRNIVQAFDYAPGVPAGWTDFAAAGRLFDRTHAGDVMTLGIRSVPVGAPAGEAWRMLRSSAMPAVFVVQPDGSLAGVILAERIPPAIEAWEGVTAEQVMERDVVVADEATPFERLREFFTRDNRPAVVIRRSGRPVGLVTPDCLAALGVPVGPETFAAGRHTAGLAVPDLRPLAAD